MCNQECPEFSFKVYDFAPAIRWKRSSEQAELYRFIQQKQYIQNCQLKYRKRNYDGHTSEQQKFSTPSGRQDSVTSQIKAFWMPENIQT